MERRDRRTHHPLRHHQVARLALGQERGSSIVAPPPDKVVQRSIVARLLSVPPWIGHSADPCTLGRRPRHRGPQHRGRRRAGRPARTGHASRYTKPSGDTPRPASVENRCKGPSTLAGGGLSPNLSSPGSRPRRASSPRRLPPVGWRFSAGWRWPRANPPPPGSRPRRASSPRRLPPVGWRFSVGSARASGQQTRSATSATPSPTAATTAQPVGITSRDPVSDPVGDPIGAAPASGTGGHSPVATRAEGCDRSLAHRRCSAPAPVPPPQDRRSPRSSRAGPA